MPYSLKTKGLILVPGSILLLVVAVLTVSYLTVIELSLPTSLDFTIGIRALGVFFLLGGLKVMWSVFRLRRPVDVLISTYITFSKVINRIPLDQPAERTETLTVAGPYRYARHPLYLGVVLLWFSFWLISDYTPIAIATVLFFLWFEFVITPLEEKELTALFGDQYTNYKHQVYRLIPFKRLRK